jgi:hypothetical protein
VTSTAPTLRSDLAFAVLLVLTAVGWFFGALWGLFLGPPMWVLLTIAPPILVAFAAWAYRYKRLGTAAVVLAPPALLGLCLSMHLTWTLLS